ncbi:ShlB/FhaC/HecB family hemolysin secretion/activation protein [Oxalobacteraceae bacterium A2-2]
MNALRYARAAVLSLLPAAALAQQAPAPLAPLAPQVTPRDLRPETPPKPPVTLPQRGGGNAIPPGADQLFVSLGGLQLQGGFPELSQASAALAAPLRGQRTAVSAFYLLADAIEQLYREAGYPLVRVVVPPQSLDDGATLRLMVVDGYIEKIDADALPPRARRHVLRMLQPLAARRHLREAELERALTLAARAPGLSLRSTLGPGAGAGATVLVLDGELQTVNASLAADNRLGDALGPWQETVQLRLNQPFGWGEQAYLYLSGGLPLSAATHATAARRVGGGGLIVPLTANGLSLNPEFTVSDTKPRSPIAELASRSQLERATVRLVYPAMVSRQQELSLTASLDASRQTDSLPYFGFELDVDRLRTLRLVADWSRNLDNGRVRASATWSQGMARLGARRNDDIYTSGLPMSRSGASSSYSKLEGLVDYERWLPWNVLAHGSARGQWALRGILPSAELFSLDGEDALSMLHAGALSDDGGWSLRQELSRPLVLPERWSRFSVAPYVFGAAAKPFSKLEGGTPYYLGAAWGLGLRLGYRGASLAVEHGRARVRPLGVSGTQTFFKLQVQY